MASPLHHDKQEGQLQSKKISVELLLLPSCGTQNNAPPNMAVSDPWNLEYLTCYGKRDFAGVIMLRMLRWEDYPRLSGPNVITRVPYKREEGGAR